MRNLLSAGFSQIVSLFFPKRCVVCGNLLKEWDEGICLHCNLELKRTHYAGATEEGSRLERRFWGKFPLGQVAAFLYYSKYEKSSRLIIHQLKYSGREDLGVTFGRLMATEMRSSGIFKGVDMIVPVPLHPDKLRQRGYNQSERIACGISQVTGIPVDTESLVRRKHTQTQTKLSFLMRWRNMEDVFRLVCPERFVGKHVLLVDDVITSTATLTACGDQFAPVEGIRISILALSAVHG